MQDRQKKILKAVVREYRRSGQPVASQLLSERYDFDFSPATVRAEMLWLDEEGYLEQPYTSAGRVPTDKAWRFLVGEYLDEELMPSEKAAVKQKMSGWQDESTKETAQFLADCSRGLGLSGLFGRDNRATDFHSIGLRWLLDEPEFSEDELKNILKSFDTLEEEFSRFFCDINEEVEVFIGRENPIKQLRHCSLMVTGFTKDDEKGVLGILGPKRMNYQRNKFVIEEARKKIKAKK